MKKHICFLLDFYPTEGNHACIFAKNLIYAIAEKGIKCTVISPQPVLLNNILNRLPLHRVETTPMGNSIDIYMPYYLYLSSKRFLIKKSMDNHFHVVLKTLKKYHIEPDYVYGHFFFQCGLTAARVGEKLNIPSYAVCGENSTRLAKGNTLYQMGLKFAGWTKIIDKLTGIISVSSYNKELLLKNGFLASDEKIYVSPNAIEKSKFYKQNKELCRESLEIPQKAFVVVFSGIFCERKGFEVLCKALNNCDNVYSIFVGSDTIKPGCKNVLFSGRLQQKDVQKYLCAADVFVLPTLGEGCCNAIIEALACGVPVISSNLPFNDDILNENNSIRVNPNSEDEIRRAIEILQHNSELLDRLTQGAKNSNCKDISERAGEILNFMGVYND